MIWKKDITDLKNELKETCEQIKTTNDRELRFALINYANSIKNAIYSIDPSSNLEDIGEICSERNLNIYNSTSKEYDERLCKDFIGMKAFHKRFLEDILFYKERVDFKWSNSDTALTEYSESDFLEILYYFLKSIDQENLFYQIIKNGQIYSLITDIDYNKGSTLYNPVTRKSIVFVRNPELTLETMGFVSHEIGHVFDQKNMNINIKRYNEYLTNSFYSEVISRLFEKLLIDYIINNNIELAAAKKMITSYDMDYYFKQFNAFLLSTLNNGVYLNNKPIDMDTKGFYNQFKDYFDSEEEAQHHQEISGNIILNEIYAYSYADIIATFLFEEFKKNGFYNKAFKNFMKNRFNQFSSELFERNNWTPERFGKIYSKELEIFRK